MGGAGTFTPCGYAGRVFNDVRQGAGNFTPCGYAGRPCDYNVGICCFCELTFPLAYCDRQDMHRASTRNPPIVPIPTEEHNREAW